MRVISASGESFSETTLTLPQNSIILWGSATAPAGWEIYSPALGKFVKGAAAGAIDTSSLGNATHSHTIPTTNSAGAHTHTFYVSLNGSGGTTEHAGSIVDMIADDGHDHSVSYSTPSSGAHTHTNNNTSSINNHPQYYRLYWIRATAEAVLPVGGVLFYTSASSLTGLQLCNGSNGAPNINGRFIYGASASGDLGVIGGVDSHTHASQNTTTGGGHTHDLAGDSGYGGASQDGVSWGSTTVSSGFHVHSITGTSGSSGSHTHAIPTSSSGSNLPPYINLACLMNLFAEELFANLIIGFVGSSSSLPTGWSLCTGAGSTVNLVDRYIRVVTGTTLGTGGALTHSHTIGTTGVQSATSHAHTSPVSRGGSSSSQKTYGGTREFAASTGHSHTFGLTYVAEITLTHTHTVGTTGSSNHEPPHIKIYFIQKQ